MPDASFASAATPARYKLLTPSHLPIPRRPILGYAEESLESPVLLTQVKAEPSPTTGTFFMPFKPPSCLESSPTRQNLLRASILECSSRSCSGFAKNDSAFVHHKQEESALHDLTLSISPSSMSAMQLQAGNNKPDASTASVESFSPDDGYKWRKYGQKLFGGSELPRSYYECVHPGCQAKKQLEFSRDGQITDIINRGNHDHPRPHPGNQSSVPAILPVQEEEGINHLSVTSEDVPSGVTTRQSSVPPSNGVEEVVATAIGINSNNVPGDDDPGLKRRREAAAILDDSSASKAIREPRVVVQTLSEIDVLDDGYRWRKYGQKIVKGNPNPRSYYKCTNTGCGVRKHVERSSHDPKAVITTYEGRHNHDVPTPKGPSHDMDSPMMAGNDNDKASQASAFLGMRGLYKATGHLPLQCHQLGATEIISLDLEVGLSPRYDRRDDNMLQAQLTREMPHFNFQRMSSSSTIPILRATANTTIYGCPSTHLEYYIPHNAGGENLSSNMGPLNPSCSAYKSSMGSLLAGP